MIRGDTQEEVRRKMRVYFDALKALPLVTGETHTALQEIIEFWMDNIVSDIVDDKEK